MNERIRELAEQAWVYQVRVYEDNGVRTFGEKEKVFSKEKFAELIVRECAQLALNEQQRYRNISHRDMIECAVAMSNYQLLLKEHFGVEE